MSRALSAQKYLETGKRLEDAATPGPWTISEDSDEWGDLYRVGPVQVPYNREERGVNADFVSDARERLPRYRCAIEEVIRLAEMEIEKKEAEGVHRFSTPDAVLELIALHLGDEKAGD